LIPLTAWSQNGSPPETMPAMERIPVGDDEPAADEAPFDAGRRTTVPTAIPTNLFDIIRAGGPLMIPIGVCSVIAVLFGIERLVVLRRRRVIPRDFVVRFIDLLQNNELDRASALELCEQNGSPVASIFAHAVRKWGKPSVEVEQAVIDGGERQVSHMRKHLRILNAVSTISPLLGLLGTVIGMIICFNQIASTSAMGKAEQLAGGIGVALITTAGGLCVAIPALILYMYLVGRVDSLVMEMDHLAQKVVNLISAEAIGSPGPQPGAVLRSTAGTAAKVRPPATSVVEPKEPIRR
jgi:biopolymer transport protein ExbB